MMFMVSPRKQYPHPVAAINIQIAPTGLFIQKLTESVPATPTRVLDAMVSQAISGTVAVNYQLSASTPAAWASSNPAVATVDQNGLVIYVSDGTATITATAGNAVGRWTRNMSAVATDGYAAPIYQPDTLASAHVLVVYNADDSAAVSAKTYYHDHRPGASVFNYLALHLGATTPQSVTAAQFESLIAAPIRTFVSETPTIRYIVTCGCPTQIVDPGDDGMHPQACVSWRLARLHQTGTVTGRPYNGIEYNGSGPFDVAQFGKTFALVGHLFLGNWANTIAMIDRLEDMPGQETLSISPNLYSGYANTDVWLETATYMGGATEIAQTAAVNQWPAVLQSAGVPANRIHLHGSMNFSCTNVGFYSNFSDHAGLPWDWPTSTSMTGGVNESTGHRYLFSGDSGWYAAKILSSTAGNWSYQAGSQGKVQGLFDPSALGGFPPICALLAVMEPYVSQLAPATFAARWMTGKTAGEAAASEGPQMALFGDPMVTR